MTHQYSIAVSVNHGDVLHFQSDVLVLKHAQALYGVDEIAYERLHDAGIKLKMPKVGSHQLIRAEGTFGADQLLFVGVKPLHEFNYGEIRDFGRRSMSILSLAKPSPRHVSMTIHGPGYGLDETESFESVLAGVIESIAKGDCPESLEIITIVERDRNCARRLQTVLSRLLPTGRLQRTGRGPLMGLDVAAQSALRSAGHESSSKSRVFVAMPFADEMSDLFHYGIQGAVNAAGLLAERADLASFTGDVMDWVRTRISTANLVIADLTSSNPNVFLEIGYAWGKGIPTVLIAKSSEPLAFDVRSQRCILYVSIKDLEEKLERELIGLGMRTDKR